MASGGHPADGAFGADSGEGGMSHEAMVHEAMAREIDTFVAREFVAHESASVAHGEDRVAQEPWNLGGPDHGMSPIAAGAQSAETEFQPNRLQLRLANWSVERKQWVGLGISALLSVMGCVGLGVMAGEQLAEVARNRSALAPETPSEQAPNDRIAETVLRDAQVQLMVQVAIASLLVVAIHGGIAYVLTRTIAIPLEQLKRSAQTLEPGQMLNLVSTDELGDLALVLNERSIQLGEMFTQLSDARDRFDDLSHQKRQETEAQRQETEQLQKRVMELLLEIDGARQGNLTVRARVTDDEMGSVADAFNSTVASLQGLVLQVQAVASQVIQSVSASDQSVGVLADAATQQAQSMTNALQSVEEMSVSIEGVAETASEAASISRRASAAADAGGDAMNQTVLSINALRGNVAETSKKVKHLTESSQEISKIVGLISEISAKTNLLAFNASIEAVRAGEHGQGFRIVADEVRRLAEQVTDATQEIEQLVTGIQLETAEVLTMMERGTEQVVTGTRLVDTTRTTLASLVETNQEIDGLLQSISASTSSQTAASSLVSATMQSVATLAQSSSTESATVAETLRQLVAVSHQLQHSVEQFQAGQS